MDPAEASTISVAAPVAASTAAGVAATGLPNSARPHLRTAPSSQEWPPQALALAEQLQRQLAIADRDWHALKHQRSRRAAEQIAAAVVQLLSRDLPGQRQPTAAREQAIALLEHALAWLKAEISDPGCPSHGR